MTSTPVPSCPTKGIAKENICRGVPLKAPTWGNADWGQTAERGRELPELREMPQAGPHNTICCLLPWDRTGAHLVPQYV